MEKNLTQEYKDFTIEFLKVVLCLRLYSNNKILSFNDFVKQRQDNIFIEILRREKKKLINKFLKNNS